MKNMRYLMCAAVLSLVLSVPSLAATGRITFSDPTVTEGSEVNVTMKVKSEDGTLSRADVTVGYDTGLLEFISGTDADGGAGTVRIHGASNGAGTGTLEYNLRFRTISAGTAAIRIGTQEVYDSNEAMVQITHEGSSAVSIVPEVQASGDASLSVLSVSPGTLSPAFAPDVTSYEVIVGTDVEALTVNAQPEDGGASLVISGNEALNMGENNVMVTVTAANGTTQAVYSLRVMKQEGGPSQSAVAAAGQEAVNEGVKLSAKEKTITIMSPGSDVEIPAGFAESTIDVDGHSVRGWVWKADNEHQYVIVYGMNDAGELHFYRYDLKEKTIQQYFTDPVGVETQKRADRYPDLIEKYDDLVGRYNTQFIICCVLAVIILALIGFIVALLRAMKKLRRTDKVRRINTEEETRPKKEEPDILGNTRDLKTIRRKQKTEPENYNEDLGITRIIRPEERKAVEDLEVTDLEEEAGARPEEGVSGATQAVPQVSGQEIDIEEL